MSAASASLPLSNEPLWRPAHNPYLIAIAVTLATFMEVLDTTIVNVALPHIAGNLSAGVDESTWVLTSYLVSNAIILPLSGWLSSMIGRKRFYMTCVVLFTLSSTLCGLAPNLEMLVFFRVLQGLGGGGLQPSEQAILVDTFPAQKRGMGMALYGIAVVCAPILGPTLGGWITDNYSWRWVFFINIPVGILSLMLTSQLVSDPPYLLKRRAQRGERRVDLMGLLFIAMGLGCLQVVLDKGQREDWFESNFIVIFSIMAAVGIVAAIIWEWRSHDPLVDLHLLKERNFAVATVVMFFLGFTLFGSTVLLPLMLQMLFGYTALDAGLVLSPGAIVTLFLMPVVGIALGKLQPRMLIALGIVVASLSLFVMSRFTLDIDYRHAAYSRMIMGAGLAFLFVPINTAAYFYLPREKNNNASGIINLARNLGGSCGVAFAATMLARWSQVHQNQLVGHLSPYDPEYQAALQKATQMFQTHGADPVQALQQAQQLLYGLVQKHAMMLAFLDNYRLMGVLFLCMLPLLLLMRRARATGGMSIGH